MSARGFQTGGFHTRGFFEQAVAAVGRIMGAIAGLGGLAGKGGLAGRGGGLAG